MRLRPATPRDLSLLRRWDEQPHVVAANPNDDWGWETELARTPGWRELLIAELAGRPIGFVQIIDPAREESRYWGAAPPKSSGGFSRHDDCCVYRLEGADWIRDRRAGRERL